MTKNLKASKQQIKLKSILSIFKMIKSFKKIQNKNDCFKIIKIFNYNIFLK